MDGRPAGLCHAVFQQNFGDTSRPRDLFQVPFVHGEFTPPMGNDCPRNRGRFEPKSFRSQRFYNIFGARLFFSRVARFMRIFSSRSRNAGQKKIARITMCVCVRMEFFNEVYDSPRHYPEILKNARFM